MNNVNYLHWIHLLDYGLEISFAVTHPEKQTSLYGEQFL